MVFRLFSFLFFIFLRFIPALIILLVNGGRYTRSYRNQNSQYYNYEDNPIIIGLASAIKLDTATRKAANYIKKRGNILSLCNQYVYVEYNKKQKQIKCLNKHKQNETFVFNWSDHINNSVLSPSFMQTTFEDNFCRLCIFFDYKATFKDIFNFFSEDYQFNIQYSDDDSKKSSNSPETNIKASKTEYFDVDDYFSGENGPKKLIDINSASLEEINSLPGITIITAKRIIKYREENNGFKTKEEFYTKFSIKQHFIKQLDKLIIVFDTNAIPEEGFNLYPQYQKDNSESNNNDRIIDI